MKRILPIIGAALLLIGCKKEETPASSAANKIIVGLSADYPPFEYFKDGKIVGFDVALMEALAQRIGVDVEFKDMNFDGIIGALQSKRIDASISSITATEERKQAVDFTAPYYAGSISLVCTADALIATANELKGQTVGLQTGSIYEMYATQELKPKNPELVIKGLPKVPDLIQDLKSKRIVGILMGSTEAKRLLIEQPTLKVIPVDGSETELAIALPKGSPLKDKLDQALAAMKADGSLEKITQEWLQ
ncbi:ABC transporter substrate-binding protein [Candidatus Odyssella thessalonicensis]|uniref:ABC transporter substrate-binding protein n=1 Tax=Candidatus Odyssella thessalonicensis TaxID=84647 RepID=UPI000225BEA8|nr:ABC transporter substrate-binding protein [Candidatus Odyssella thessalonicensis]